MAHPYSHEPARAPRTWWPWAVAVVVFLGTAASNREAEPPHPVLLGTLLAVLAVAPAALPTLVTRLGVPEPASLAVSGALVGGYFAWGYEDGPVFLALPAVTFVVASRSSVPRWAPWAVAGVVAVWLGLAGRYAWWDDAGEKHIWQMIGSVGVVAASGAIAIAVRSRLEARAERVGRAATEERLRMAQDLHDGVGHGLAVIAMQAGAALHVLDRDPARARASLEAIRATSKESLEALRAELAAMSGGAVSAGTAAPRRPASGLADLPALLERVSAAGLRVELLGDAGQVPDRIGEVVYSVVQESLTNVLRHAQAGRATIALDRALDAALVVSVTDDGQGAAVAAEPGMGLAGMRSRVESVGGRFEAGPGPGGAGFRVRAELPLTGEGGAR